MHKARFIVLFLSLLVFLAFTVVWSFDDVANDNNLVLRTVYCSSTAELQLALKNVQPGDRIMLKPGIYTGEKNNSGYSYAHFYSGKQGTAAKPIIIESEDPSDPAILEGNSGDWGYVLYITGDYWEVRNLKIRTGKKGIMLDKSNYSLIYGCEVFEIGEEGIHLRDGSSHNIIENCNLHDIGLFNPGYGEGVYVGSDKGKWDQFEKACDHNIINNCIFGPHVAAEHIDIKEGTTGTIVEHCLFNGTGITGENSADSFIDVKGNNSIIRNNIGHRNSNFKIVDAFQVNERVPGWGIDNEFYGNTLYLDNFHPYIINVKKGSAKASDNIRIPEGNKYKGRVKVY